MNDIIFNVYSFKLMQFLDSKGYKFVGTKQCEENPKRTIFWYEDSVELREAVNQYTNQWKDLFNNGK